MRKTLSFLAACALICLTAFSCQREVPKTETGISVSTNILNFSAEGGGKTISVTAPEAVAVTSDASWLTITPAANGRTFDITATANVAEAGKCAVERKADIIVTSGSETVSVSVIQEKEGVVFEIEGNPETIMVPYTGGEIDINLKRNVSSYEIGIPAEATWISQVQTKAVAVDKLVFMVQKNDSDARVAELTFVSEEGGTRKVSVKQESQYPDILNVDPIALSFDRNQGEATVAVTTYYNWTATCDASWLTITKAQDNKSFKLNVQKNEGKDGMKPTERKAVIEVATSTRSMTVSVVQTGEGRPEDTINGLFSVAADRQVYFSRGNMRCIPGTRPAWGFCDNQYDYQTVYDPTVITLFTWGYGDWSTDPATGTNAAADSFVDWGTAYDAVGTWRTLTYSEWDYLFNLRGVGDSYYRCGVNVCGSPNCLVIAPDGNTVDIASSYNKDSWAVAEASGFVCLPFGGYRGGTSLDFSYGAFYWTSTVKTGTGTSAHIWNLKFSAGSVNLDASYGNWGYNVRLVSDK